MSEVGLTWLLHPSLAHTRIPIYPKRHRIGVLKAASSIVRGKESKVSLFKDAAKVGTRKHSDVLAQQSLLSK